MTFLTTKILNPLLSLRHLYSIRIETQEELLHWQTGRSITTSIERYKLPVKPEEAKKKSLTTNNSVLVIDTNGEIAGIGIWDGISMIKPKVVYNAIS